MTAAELMTQLNQDEDFVRTQQQRDEKFKALEKHFREAELPLVEALNDVVGISINSVSDLLNSTEPYPQAIPVLVIHLGYEYPHCVREAIARALTVEYAGERAHTGRWYESSENCLTRRMSHGMDLSGLWAMQFPWLQVLVTLMKLSR